MSAGTHLLDRSARSYIEWNDDGTIRKFDARSCAHCHGMVAPRAPAGVQGRMWMDEAGVYHRDTQNLYDHNCKGCGGAFLCKGCAYEMRFVLGDACINYERRIEAFERLADDLGRYPKIDRDQAILLGAAAASGNASGERKPSFVERSLGLTR